MSAIVGMAVAIAVWRSTCGSGRQLDSDIKILSPGTTKFKLDKEKFKLDKDKFFDIKREDFDGAPCIYFKKEGETEWEGPPQEFQIQSWTQSKTFQQSKTYTEWQFWYGDILVDIECEPDKKNEKCSEELCRMQMS